LHTLQPGTHVNLEIDLIARYVERMLSLDPQQTASTAR
jgi:riboflavin synthase alpha subunit